ncbi:MAG: Bacterial alpha-L-rhamnosidase [bacterium ADurb.Bin429]|nr:MAG: Bacterial alpha-L-rhamnosidase [bacterium ADurb.Bin429]
MTDDALAHGPLRTAWRGKWIWTEDVAADRNVYAHFSRPFTCDTEATLDIAITADSHYMLYLDGRFIARGPARAHLEYYTVDTFSLPVSSGDHALVVLVHHVGEVNATMMLGRPGLLADVTLTVDGNIEDLSTGADWQAKPSKAWKRDLPCMMSHFGFWEELDLACLDGECTSHGWHFVFVIGEPGCGPWTRLVTRSVEPVEYHRVSLKEIVNSGTWSGGTDDPIPSVTVASRERHPGNVSPTCTFERENGYVTIDFGRTVSGYVIFICRCTHPGAIIEVSYDELLTQEGAVNPERTYAHMTDRFILPAGEGEYSTTHPRGFRYVTLDVTAMSGAVTIEAMWALEETYPFRLQGAFQSSDAQLYRFMVKSAENVRICTTDCFTDCSTRERVHWTEDLYMHSRAAAYAFGDTAMMRHALFQAAQCALPDGRINGFMPSERTNCAFAASSIMWLHTLVDYWEHAGHEDIEALMPTVKRAIACIETQMDEDRLIARWPAGQFWDWAPVELEGCLLLTNAAYAWALTRLCAYAVFAELGHNLQVRADRLREAAHARFWDAERGFYRDAIPAEGQTPIYSQQANTMAVLVGICPKAERVPLLRRIIDPANLGPVPVGEDSLKAHNRPSSDKLVPMGTLWFAHFLVQALFENGMVEEALAQMRFFWGAYDDLPTFPETRIQHGNTGMCHGWAAGPAYLLPAYVLGMQPVDAGWREARFAPHPGDVALAGGTFRTPHGELSAHWHRQESRYHARLTVPDGVSLRVVLPDREEMLIGPTEWQGEWA